MRVENLAVGYDDVEIQRDLNFAVARSQVFVLMGGSGCGKSTLMKCMIGLLPPLAGDVFIGGANVWRLDADEREKLARGFGVVYQSGALWSSMTLIENLEVPLREYTRFSNQEIHDLARFKLALVGLAGFEGYYPAQLSGGMRKRAGVARALSLDPNLLFFDEPSAGLDPITSAMMDRLILELRDSLGITIVMVTHELASIFAVADVAGFLDADRRTMIAMGAPRELLKSSDEPKVRAFLTRDEDRINH